MIGYWITTKEKTGDVVPTFRKNWKIDTEVCKAVAKISALGVYEAHINGKRISNYVLAPGWTAYQKRLQYQSYDITSMLREENEIEVVVGKGWMRSPMPGFIDNEQKDNRQKKPVGLIAEICIEFRDGSKKVISTDTSWDYSESPIRFSEIYDGEYYDATYHAKAWTPCVLLDWSKEILIPQEGEEILEKEEVAVKEIIITPKKEVVLDFGQVITGYVKFNVRAKKGDIVEYIHGEILDNEGNFYNDNYRNAKAEIKYVCREGYQNYKPHLTFFGFRYIKIINFPEKINKENFNATVVYSDIQQTGFIESGNELVNRLISNIFWGQKGNFLDVPTDCPQRDERLGWTGDAAVFVKAASYNYDVERFFGKWLRDLACEQYDNGGIPDVVPDYFLNGKSSSVWGDAAVICPWQIYITYGNIEILKTQFESMKGWISFITEMTTTQYLWTGGSHYGDWLAIDAPEGSRTGATRKDFIASAFYYSSTNIFVKAGKILGYDMKEYEDLASNIRKRFIEKYSTYTTQTEYVLAAYFKLCEEPQKVADELAGIIRTVGCVNQTGFVGTPFILHVLSRYGYQELAYTLLLREEYPSWLYSVKKGATTVWEHWDGIKEDGSLWDKKMNSFNHYAYGSIIDWMYEEALGIKPCEENPGFTKLFIAPKPDKRLKWMGGGINTSHGKVRVKWTFKGNEIRYNIITPVPAIISINGKETQVDSGSYIFWGKAY
ncbi:MAG TPA: glycoside hydrolase family 78 protein [Candidatus Dorea intestinavium]|nr:glycoside hydrolase family 78 protein [Candidatus Dorea intestinavium]